MLYPPCHDFTRQKRIGASNPVFATCQLWGYFDNQELVGIIAFREGWVDQLYILLLSQRRGTGTGLLALARSRFSSLSLSTFQRDTVARRF
jgi:putative acetyltransferase